MILLRKRSLGGMRDEPEVSDAKESGDSSSEVRGRRIALDLPISQPTRVDFDDYQNLFSLSHSITFCLQNIDPGTLARMVAALFA